MAVYGLYGAATSKWDMSAKVEESGVFDSFWDTLSFVVNGIVFFFSGVACINFFVRCGLLLRSIVLPQTGREFFPLTRQNVRLACHVPNEASFELACLDLST